MAGRQNEGDALFQRLFVKQRCSRLHKASHWPRQAAHIAIRGYQLSFSMLVGRHCRHWPSCSAYTDEAILRKLIEDHFRYTGSFRAREILGDWETSRGKFIKVMPTEYRRALGEMWRAANPEQLAA